jgi:hypothetical protein
MMAVDLLILQSMYPPSQPEPAPLTRLACAIVTQAVEDLRAPDPLLQRDARRFFAGNAFTTWAQYTPLDVSAVRRQLVILRLTDDDPTL